MVFQYIFYGEKQQAIQQKRSVLSKLKGNYTYNQAWCLINANQSTNIGFKMLTVSESDCATCVISYLGGKFAYIRHVIDTASRRQLCYYAFVSVLKSSLVYILIF